IRKREIAWRHAAADVAERRRVAVEVPAQFAAPERTHRAVGIGMAGDFMSAGEQRPDIVGAREHSARAGGLAHTCTDKSRGLPGWRRLPGMTTRAHRRR